MIFYMNILALPKQLVYHGIIPFFDHDSYSSFLTTSWSALKISFYNYDKSLFKKILNKRICQNYLIKLSKKQPLLRKKKYNIIQNIAFKSLTLHQDMLKRKIFNLFTLHMMNPTKYINRECNNYIYRKTLNEIDRYNSTPYYIKHLTVNLESCCFTGSLQIILNYKNLNINLMFKDYTSQLYSYLSLRYFSPTILKITDQILILNPLSEPIQILQEPDHWKILSQNLRKIIIKIAQQIFINSNAQLLLTEKHPIRMGSNIETLLYKLKFNQLPCGTFTYQQPQFKKPLINNHYLKRITFFNDLTYKIYESIL